MHTEAGAGLHVGDRFCRTHVFNPHDVRAFALLAGDTNPLHHDEAAARRSRFGELIVSGTHTSALLLGLTAAHFAQQGTVVGLGFAVEFLLPVRATAAVQIAWEITAVTARTRRRQVVDLVGSLVDEEGRACVTATGRLLVGPQI